MLASLALYVVAMPLNDQIELPLTLAGKLVSKEAHHTQDKH